MRRKASRLCALVLGASLFLVGCKGEGRKHGSTIYHDQHIIGYWDAVKNEGTTIRNFQDLPEDYTTKWSKDKSGILRNFVYDIKGNYIGYIEPVDPFVKERIQARNFVEARYYDKKMVDANRYISSISIFVPDTMKITPQK